MKIDSFGAAIVLVDRKKVLMQLRDEKPSISYPGCWCIPGGTVEDGETPRRGAVRELREETGYLSEKPKLLYTNVYQLPDGKTVKRFIFYDVYDNKQKIKCYEGQKIEFKSPSELKNEKVYPGHLDFMKKAIKLTRLS